MSDQRESLTWFGALGSLKHLGQSWRKTVYGKASVGLYATLAAEGHGAVRVTLRPAVTADGPPRVSVEWIRFDDTGPAEAKQLYNGRLA